MERTRCNPAWACSGERVEQVVDAPERRARRIPRWNIGAEALEQKGHADGNSGLAIVRG
jgi:hypothetical protein